MMRFLLAFILFSVNGHATCAPELSEEARQIETVRKAIALNTQLNGWTDSTADIPGAIEKATVLSEGLALINHGIFTLAQAQAVCDCKLPDGEDYRINRLHKRTNWLRERMMPDAYFNLHDLGDSIYWNHLTWGERVKLLRKMIAIPNLADNVFLSTAFLDRAFNLDSQGVFRGEQKLSPQWTMDDPADGQRKGFGAAPHILWSNFGVIDKLISIRPPRDGETFVDIGSGIGHVGMYVSAFYPKTKFIGVELVKSRIDAARAAAKAVPKNRRPKYLQMDLSREELPEADVYYFFNSLSGDPYAKVLARLHDIATRRKIVIYSAYDMNGGFQEQKSWLRELGSFERYRPREKTDPETGEITGFMFNYELHVYESLP